MTDEYFLWRVTFSYQTPGEMVHDLAKQTYTLIAKDKTEAKSKAFADFSETPVYTDLNLSREGLLKTRVQQLQKQKIRLPYFTLGDDQENFLIIPRISGDRSSLEYIVAERKGK